MLFDRSNLRSSLWAVLYSLLVVIVCSAMIDAGISYFIVVPLALFALPLLTSLPFLIWLRLPKSDAGD